MKRALTCCLIALALMGLPGLGLAADPEKTGTIEGQVVKADENSLVVKKADGTEVSLTLNKQTKMRERPKAGDEVEAFVTPQGIVTSVQPLKGGLRR